MLYLTFILLLTEIFYYYTIYILLPFPTIDGSIYPHLNVTCRQDKVLVSFLIWIAKTNEISNKEIGEFSKCYFILPLVQIYIKTVEAKKQF